MKKTFLIISACIMLSSCGSKTEAEKKVDKEKSATDGTWEIVKAEGMLAETNIGTQYIFDGEKLTLRGGGMKNEGTFEMKNDTLVFHMKTYTGDMNYIKGMKGKQMVLKMVGSDQVFYLDKK